MHSDNNPNNHLEEEALLLLAEVADLPDPDRSRRLRQWREQSSPHAAALDRAQAEWDLFAEVRVEPLSVSDRSRLGVQTLVASSMDHPLRSASVLSVMAALLIWVTNAPQDSADALRVEIAEGMSTQIHSAEFEAGAERYSTSRGEQRRVDLSDGSTLWLNWNTDVLVADQGGDIHVDVRVGDVLFEISKDLTTQFVVHAGQTFAYAADTEFAIHSHGLDDAFFQVKKGVLRLTSSAQDGVREIPAARQSFYAKGVGGSLGQADLKSIAAWREGKLVFDERPLEDTLWELAHFTERPLRVGPLAGAQPQITATYALEDADKALLQLADAHGLELVDGGEAEILVRAIDPRRR
ncbi:MAG: FecR domain-containing protein [Pseudomonadota bacterium]